MKVRDRFLITYLKPDSDVNTSLHTEKARVMERSASTSCPNHLGTVRDSLEVDCYTACTTTEGLNSKKGIGDGVSLLVGVGWSTDLGPPPFPEFTKLDLCETLQPLGVGCTLELCVQNVTTSHCISI